MDSKLHTSNEKNLQKSAILFGTKSNAYLQINRPIFTYSWLFLPIFAYLRICSKSPRIYFAFHAKYPCLFLPIFHHLTCVSTREKDFIVNALVLRDSLQMLNQNSKKSCYATT